ncbi:hypothetical protein BKA67DRAFT_6999 [Truncatella angustata]|uniref:Uncharacterized protein n=1 Tax=Truncatella angustata TaxID=152316 RepID=A0A9P8UVJ0_9PEZI|nr:uncharacterized protein BKA67DRAFT_6999 [Truncatella angustata]KAH6659158.1 hypothetical protein BKA67DRAFT_6999 [Truncatella angustata]
MTVLSDRRIHMRVDHRFLACSPGVPREFSNTITVNLGAVSFWAWPSERTFAKERGYHKSTNIFSEDVLLGKPRCICSIQGHPKISTHNVRYGRSKAVHAYDGGVAGKGIASVTMVQVGHVVERLAPKNRTGGPTTTETLRERDSKRCRVNTKLSCSFIMLVLNQDYCLVPRLWASR